MRDWKHQLSKQDVDTTSLQEIPLCVVQEAGRNGLTRYVTDTAVYKFVELAPNSSMSVTTTGASGLWGEEERKDRHRNTALA